ncbi:hypothetical protein DYB32_002683 [Aphanomyces invadans]|uniref:Uncharacterized protein n=1 Tax=Aphanomyces invadans TaxID=157072 RepID=A0A418B2U7_9STRA|nr:hypothetical protein DYB32_002683 [Aphanomyces invadans]
MALNPLRQFTGARRITVVAGTRASTLFARIYAVHRDQAKGLTRGTLVDTAVEKLAKPKPRHSPKLGAYATVEDARECRFRPKKTRASVRAMKNPACGYDFVTRTAETDSANDFIGRMDAAEQNRQKNKRQCPKCGMVQSFAEWRDKKKRCTFCGVSFVLPKVWSDVSDTFLERMEEWGRHHEANQVKIRQAVTLLERTRGTVAKSSRQKFLEKRLASRQHTDDPLAFIHDFLTQTRKQLPARSGQRRIQVPPNFPERLMQAIAAMAAAQPPALPDNSRHAI